jgi:hypothetical protein
MRLVFLHGPPGVGKLTVARALAELSGFSVFHNHLTVDLVAAVFEFGSPEFVRLREQIWISTLVTAAEAGRDVIFTFAPEPTVNHDFPLRAVAAVESAGGQILFVKLACGEDELMRRIEDPSRAAFGKLRSVARYRELRDSGAFESFSLPADVEIDSGLLSAAEAAREIAAHLSSLENE